MNAFMISGKFSIIHAISWLGPASDSAADKAAAEQAMEFYVSLYHILSFVILKMKLIIIKCGQIFEERNHLMSLC